MRHRKVTRWLGLLVALLMARGFLGFDGTSKESQFPTNDNAGEVSGVPRQRLAEAYGKLPLAFEANQGQTDAVVQFISRGSGYTMFLTANEAVLTLRKSKPQPQGSGGSNPKRDTEPLESTSSAKSMDETSMLRMKLVGANPNPEVTEEDELPGKSNYFIGNDPAKWSTNVPHYAKVRYRGIYPGVDLVYYGHQRQLEYDFVVAPGADPTKIHFVVDGANKLELDAQGDLVLRTSDEQVRLRKPLVYQETGSARREIPGSYIIEGRQQVSFRLGVFDASKPLVIDPVLVYSSYLGGSGDEIPYAIALDSSGNIYLTGETNSANFPKATPFQGTIGGLSDVFVTKLNPSGSALLYSTYLGGSGNDRGYGIAVDSSGTAYVAGGTGSNNFPTVSPIQATRGGGSVDVFVARLNASGSALIFSTFLGGSGGEFANGIALDSSGNAYITGITGSSAFPTANPLQPAQTDSIDAFVTKLNPTGTTLVYSTYLGGSGATDQGNAIAVDSSGNAYVTGTTRSGNFPTVNALQDRNGSLIGDGACFDLSGQFLCEDAFVAKLNPAGSALLYSTYLGGSFEDYGTGIAVNSSGDAYVTGFTDATDFPTRNPLQATNGGGYYDAFVAKLNPAGSALVYSTYLGRAGRDEGNGIVVDSSGNAYVTGVTSSSDFPTADVMQARGGGISDAFVAKLNPAGSALIYSSYLGGSDWDNGRSIALDSAGNAYVTGETESLDFPIASPFQLANTGGTCGTSPCDDGFVVKISETNPVPTLSSLSPSSAAAGGPAFTLTVNGSGLVTGSVVRWNGNNRTTTFVSASRLTASIPASDIATAGTVPVTVFNPAPGGGVSSPLPFTIGTGGGGTGPSIPAGGTVNGASFAAGSPVAPGSIASAFGTNLAPGDITVRLNGINAPVFAATAGQVNFQVPVELAGQSAASLTVTVGSVVSSPVTVPLAPYAPGLFTANAAGQGAILIANTAFVAAPEGTFPGSRPVNRGGFISIFATGLGAVTNPPATGVAASGDPPSLTTTAPTVTIGGVPATVSFSGLSPGFFGLYQINVEVPSSAPTGNAVSVVLVIGGATSNTVAIAVQ